MFGSKLGREGRDRGWFTIAAVLAAFGGTMIVAACTSADDDAAGIGGSGAEMDGGSTGGSAPDVQAGGAGGGGTGGVAGEAGTAGQGGVDAAFRAEPVTYVVHASPELFAFRICAQTSSGYATEFPYPDDPDHFLPKTNYPGVPVGGVVNLDALVAAIDPGTDVTMRLVKADAYEVKLAQPDLTDPPKCVDLLGGSANLDPSEFVDLDPISVDDLTAETVRTLVIRGCGPNTAVPPVACGSDYEAQEGNIGWNLLAFSPESTLEPSAALVYAAHASPALEALQQVGQTLSLEYDAPNGRTVLAPDLVVDPSDATVADFSPPSDLADYDDNGFELTAKQSNTVQEVLLDASLADVQRVTDPYGDPQGLLASKRGLLLLFVGETTTAPSWLNPDGTWNEAYDGRGLHVLALPFGMSLQ